MRLALLALLLANLALYAWIHGVFGSAPTAGSEPGRMARQVEPQRLRLLDADEVKARIARAAPAAAQPACLEFGDFGGAEVARARERLQSLLPAEHLSVHAVEGAGWYIVYLAPLKTREDAQRRAEELRAAGLREVTVIGENSPLRYGLVLGSFREFDSARAYGAGLGRRGIADVRVAERPTQIAQTRYTLSGVDAATLAKLEELAKDFPAQSLRPCR